MTFPNTTQKNFLDASAVGRTSSDPFVDMFADRDPTPSDVNYPVQKRWLNTATEAYWLLEGFSSIGGFISAIWIPFGAGGGNTIRKVGVDTFTPPGTNPVVGDVNGLITVSGNQIPASSTANVIRTDSLLPNHWTIEVQRSQAVASSTVGDNGVSHFDSADFLVDSNAFVQINPDFPYYSLTPYIVGPDVHSEFRTIGAAITQAVADGNLPQNIYIKPQVGGYTEDLTIPAGVNLVGFGDASIIKGKLTFDGVIGNYLTNLLIQTNGDYCINITGSTETTIEINNCLIRAIDHTAINFSNSDADSVLDLETSRIGVEAASIGVYNLTGPGAIIFLQTDVQILPFPGQTCLSSDGSVLFLNCVLSVPIVASGSAGVELNNCRLDTHLQNEACITISDNVTCRVTNGLLSSGTASCGVVGAGTTLQTSSIEANSTNTNVFTGGGTWFYAFTVFNGGSSGHNVATETALPTF